MINILLFAELHRTCVKADACASVAAKDAAFPFTYVGEVPASQAISLFKKLFTCKHDKFLNNDMLQIKTFFYFILTLNP